MFIDDADGVRTFRPSFSEAVMFSFRRNDLLIDCILVHSVEVENH